MKRMGDKVPVKYGMNIVQPQVMFLCVKRRRGSLLGFSSNDKEQVKQEPKLLRKKVMTKDKNLSTKTVFFFLLPRKNNRLLTFEARTVEKWVGRGRLLNSTK